MKRPRQNPRLEKTVRRMTSRRERRLITCAECGEVRPHRARGLCTRCYEAYRSKVRWGTCPSCGREADLKYAGLCRSCYRKRRHSLPITCPSCGDIAVRHTAGYCQRCYERIMRGDKQNGRVVRIKRDLYPRVRRQAKHQGITVSQWMNEAAQVRLIEVRS